MDVQSPSGSQPALRRRVCRHSCNADWRSPGLSKPGRSLVVACLPSPAVNTKKELGNSAAEATEASNCFAI